MQQFKPSASTTLRHPIKAFLNDTSGAVTVDWVVLTAALVTMVITFFTSFTADINGFLITLMASL